MPQIDKVTFLPIVFWTFIIYVSAYLALNATFLYKFLTSLKMSAKRLRHSAGFAIIRKKLVSTLMLFPWISL